MNEAHFGFALKGGLGARSKIGTKSCSLVVGLRCTFGAKTQAKLAARYGVSFKVMLVSESDAAVAAADPESLDAAGIVGWKAVKGNRLAGYSGAGTVVRGADAVEAAVLALAADGVVAIDCTATDKTTPLLKTFLERGGGVVLANKKPLADSSMADFAVLGAPAHESRCR
jgi:homoserine dehydrogenase